MEQTPQHHHKAELCRGTWAVCRAKEQPGPGTGGPRDEEPLVGEEMKGAGIGNNFISIRF